uniref:Uncharacterized protein n=1 Tax=Meloidogyne floridensis TaxID=298350 RepID=A0A915P782_9BILA
MNSAIIIDISENGASLDDDKQKCKKDVNDVKKNYNDDIAESRTSNDAELSVALIVLEELFKFDIIKEASIELYCKGRKKFLNPALSLSKGMRFLLEDGTDNTFLSKMNKLEKLYSKSSINLNDTSIILSNEKCVKNYPQNSQVEEIIKF